METKEEDPRIEQLAQLQDENQRLFNEISQLKKQKRESERDRGFEGMETKSSLQNIHNDLRKSEQELACIRKQLEELRKARTEKNSELEAIANEIKDSLVPKLKESVTKTTANYQKARTDIDGFQDEESQHLKELISQIIERRVSVEAIENELTRVSHHIAFQQSQVCSIDLEPTARKNPSQVNQKKLRRRSTNIIIDSSKPFLPLAS